MAQSSSKAKPITVGEFFERYGKALKMKLLGTERGFDRKIIEPTINRPGLALSGHFAYFAMKRLQVIGNAEQSYLSSIGEKGRLEAFRELCRHSIPSIVVSRGKRLPPALMEAADSAGVSVFQTGMITMKFVNAATIRLEWESAPRTTEHGCMVDVRGIGILVRGPSGCGKSEVVLGLLERGASLVADDLVEFRAIEGREIIGMSPELGRNHMEVRGLGIINVGALFGIGSIRLEKRLDLVISLLPVADMEDIERVGVEKKTYPLFTQKVPHVELPVGPGRDMAKLVEVAALDQKLKSFGHDSAVEFNKKLLKIMRDKRIN
ncbi:MAG: HPr(Ser) kinase/phosphatase [Verrucomicrobiota bacterium]